MKIIELGNGMRLNRYNVIIFRKNKRNKLFKKRHPLQKIFNIINLIYLTFRVKLIKNNSNHSK